MEPLKTAEDKLREKLEGDGWVVTHKGWPDFACVRDGEMMFIEVKQYKGEMLKREQHFILTNLAKLGLNCYKWTPDGLFEQILSDTPLFKPKKKLSRCERIKKSRQKLTIEQRIEKMSPSAQRQIKEWEAQGHSVYI